MRKQRFVTFIAFAIFALGAILLNTWAGQSHTKLASTKKVVDIGSEHLNPQNNQQVSNLTSAISLTANVTPTTTEPPTPVRSTTVIATRPITYTSPASSASTGYSPASGIWAELRYCESRGNYGDNTGNGYYGAYQFSLPTWESLGYAGLPSDASPAVQDQAAQRLAQRSGWHQWPVCSVRLGL
jgi:hypothetical protein